MKRARPAAPPRPLSLAEAQAAFDAASAAHRNGDTRAAEAGYRRILGAHPSHFEALHMLGVIEAQRDNLTAAANLFSRANAVKPDNPGLKNNLANVLCQLGRHAEALPLLAEAARLDPAFAEPHVNMGQALIDLGRAEEALPHYARAIEVRPDFVQAHFHRAAVLESLGRLDEALAGYERVIAMRPSHADAHCNRGNILWVKGRLEDALVAHDRAVAANPENYKANCCRSNSLRMLGHAADALGCAERAIRLQPKMGAGHCMRGLALADLKRYAEAIPSLARAIEIDPKLAEAHNGLGSALEHTGRHAEALACFDRAIALRPDYAVAYVNRAVVYNDMGRFDEALQALGRGIELAPNRPDSYSIRGNVLDAMNRHDEALEDYRRALALKPTHVDAAWNMSLVYLLLGDFERGWPDYEKRWQALSTLGKLSFLQPQWAGERLEGTLLAWGEQGIGDQVLHLGLVEELRRFARELVVAVEPRLVNLVRRSFPDLKVIALPSAMREPCDAQVPLGSVLQYLRRRWSDFPPGPRAYLRPDPERAARLRAEVRRDSRRVVGLSWISAAPAIGDAKSMTLPDLRPLLALPGVRFIDLQYGDTTAERDALKQSTGLEVERLSIVDNFSDLDGLAALASACDCVVSVSNTTVHIAGALGVPVHAMLPFAHGRLWYWHEGRDDSPWYPSVRLYRQTAHGAWADVVERVRAAVAGMA